MACPARPTWRPLVRPPNFLSVREKTKRTAHGSLTTSKDLLLTVADTINTTGYNNLGLCGELMVVFGPEHAGILAKGGLSKEDVRQELHKMLRFRFDRLGTRLRDWYRNHRPSTDVGPEVEDFPFFDDASQILIMVAGGPGLHSVVIPSVGALSFSTRERVVLPGRSA